MSVIFPCLPAPTIFFLFFRNYRHPSFPERFVLPAKAVHPVDQFLSAVKFVFSRQFFGGHTPHGNRLLTHGFHDERSCK
mgnify:CR=1 FL=1